SVSHEVGEWGSRECGSPRRRVARHVLPRAAPAHSSSFANCQRTTDRDRSAIDAYCSGRIRQNSVRCHRLIPEFSQVPHSELHIQPILPPSSSCGFIFLKNGSFLSAANSEKIEKT